MPCGNRSHNAVYEFTREGVDHLFRKENCAIVIIACNTASARALRKIQKNYLPKNFPNRKVLGVLIPVAEEFAKFSRVGVLATLGTVSSQSFPREIKKILTRRSLGEGENKKTIVFQNPAPMLVPLAEEGEKILAKGFIKKYLKPLLNKKINALALGCTHYPIFKREFKKLLPKNVKIISQDEIIPRKLKEYLKNHTELSKKLSRNRSAKILVTDKTQTVNKLTQEWFGKNIKPKLINLK